ncbi:MULTISPECIES: hypothetical protein [unclassified Methanosarcina]|uniref:hypothetical protein n=1 Tax=unclassified Methanosarcina TaxID=2644672 RepID=UPI00064F5C01|nr:MULTISPECIES: hypothetical protein [unclassified Methanosarcina]
MVTKKGFRTLGVAYREMDQQVIIEKEIEIGMTFLGFLFFFDPPKQGITETIESIEQIEIS